MVRGVAQGQAGEAGRSWGQQRLACPVSRVQNPSSGSRKFFENGTNLERDETICKVTCQRDHTSVLEQGVGCGEYRTEQDKLQPGFREEMGKICRNEEKETGWKMVFTR